MSSTMEKQAALAAGDGDGADADRGAEGVRTTLGLLLVG
jgi:hypothetical protein